jgi:hypothetical protein
MAIINVLIWIRIRIRWLLHRKFGTAVIRTRDLWICSKQLWSLEHRNDPSHIIALQIQSKDDLPEIGLGATSGCKESRIPHCLNNRPTDGRDVVGLTPRRYFTSQKDSSYLILSRVLSLPQGRSVFGGKRNLKNPRTSSGIEPALLWTVAQWLNEQCCSVPLWKDQQKTNGTGYPLSSYFLIEFKSNESFKYVRNDVRIEAFKAVTMKNGVFWDVTPCGSCKKRCFGGT